MQVLRRAVRELLERIAISLGYVAIRTWRLESYNLANRIKRIIASYDIDCVIDVGANRGQYRDFLRNQVEFDGLILSFEPDPACFKDLSARSAADPRWFVFETALGQVDGELELNIMKSSVFNSFLEPDSTETTRFQNSNVVDHKASVQMRRLDGLFDRLAAEHGMSRVYLKLDTQGFDLEVLQGATGCLQRVLAIQSEISVMPIYKGAPTVDQSIPAFRELGYEVSGIYAVSESRFPHAIEFDCVLVSRSAANAPKPASSLAS